MATDLSFPHAETRYELPGVPVAARCAFLHWHHSVPPFIPDSQAVGESLPVSVNHGRWIVSCRCGGAQFASHTDPRFFCVDCLNGWCGGQWAAITWPDDPAGIEEALQERPTQLRNWTPSETIEDLREENRAHRAEMLGLPETADVSAAAVIASRGRA